MEPDATYKHLLSFAFMVEELLRWLVADLHGMHALVDALDFSTLTRMHEQSVTAGAVALHRHSNDMVWQVHRRGRSDQHLGHHRGNGPVQPFDDAPDLDPLPRECKLPWLGQGRACPNMVKLL